MRKSKPPCPVCGRLNCTNPAHTKDARRQLVRPTRWAEIARRKEFLDQYVRTQGVQRDGTWYGRCQCPEHQGDPWTPRSRLVAGHITAVALGGAETGALRAECRTCSDREGAGLTNRGR